MVLIITILDIIHRPVSYLKQDVCETEFCPQLQMEYTHLGPIRASLCHRRDRFQRTGGQNLPERFIEILVVSKFPTVIDF
jgi:hypothetical protein